MMGNRLGIGLMFVGYGGDGGVCCCGGFKIFIGFVDVKVSYDVLISGNGNCYCFLSLCRFWFFSGF